MVLEALGVIVLAPIAATVVLSVAGGIIHALTAPSDAEIARRKKAEDNSYAERLKKQRAEWEELRRIAKAEHDKRMASFSRYVIERDKQHYLRQEALRQAYRDKYR